MAVTTDIAATYRGPGRMMRALLARGRREDMALIFLLMGGILVFVALSPREARIAIADDSVPLRARLYWTGLMWVFFMPLAAYAVAALSRLVARLAGGRGSAYGARLALFWAVLAAAPVGLFYGIAQAFIGPSMQLTLITALWWAVFAWFWLTGLWVSETGTEAADGHV
jgi:hypothetical protein